MLHEIRTYTLVPGGVRDYLRIYNECGREVQVSLLGQLVAVMTPESGNLNQLIYHWTFADFEDRHIDGRIEPPLEYRRSAACLYSVSPDAHFIIDRLANDDPAIIISACSGHGFKHAPAIGELVAAAVAEAMPLPTDFARTRAALAVPT